MAPTPPSTSPGGSRERSRELVSSDEAQAGMGAVLVRWCATARLPELRLRIAGAALDSGGPALLEQLRARAAAPDLAGRVEFAGPLADPASALRDAGCLLHCAEREPFGLVLAEALASGTPVVAPASFVYAESTSL